MVHRSHAPSRGARGAQPGTAPWPHGQFGGVLALQRLAGNRATRALVAREVVTIGKATVRVASDTEKKDAERIINEANSKYGVLFDSIAAQRTARKHYDDMKAATDEQLNAAEAKPWTYEELKAFERALKHFRTVLGDARKKSNLKAKPQEIGTVGKLGSSPDDDPKHTTNKSRGEHFPEAQTVAIYEPGSADDTSAEALERNATHEIAHAVFGPHLEAFIKATPYWSKKFVKSKKPGAEAPPDTYAATNASEDLAQSVAYFFTDRKRLKDGLPDRKTGEIGNACRKREAFIAGIVGRWT
ncbi:MAG TPA: hypothetical protein VEX67_09830 [Solirubrobacteraceae bacterium]|nr:hypothetical protein [Solirubrobacteraceae bacterium]